MEVKRRMSRGRDSLKNLKLEDSNTERQSQRRNEPKSIRDPQQSSFMIQTPMNKNPSPHNESGEAQLPISKHSSTNKVNNQSIDGITQQMNQIRFNRHLTKVWRSNRNFKLSKASNDVTASINEPVKIRIPGKQYERARSADVEGNIIKNITSKGNKSKVFPYLTLSESINNPKSTQNDDTQGGKKVETQEDQGLMQAIQLDRNEEQDDSFLSHSFQTQRQEEYDGLKQEYMRSTTTALRESEGKDVLRLRHLKRYGRCLILPDDPWFGRWNVFLVGTIIFAVIFSPYRVAFFNNSDDAWMGIEIALDLIFLVDLIFNFITAYFDNEENLIDNQKKIAYNYVKTWLFIDLFSITPVSFFMKNSVNDLFKITRMARINRIIKTFKLVRMMKDVKSKKHKANRDYQGNQSSSTFRLLFFIMMFLILCHNLACLWFMIAKLQDFNEDTWVVRFGYDGLPIFTQYVACFYFIITTITTVGYGDFNAKTEMEMIFCCVLMIIGVIAYSISISSFTSIIAANDKKRAEFKNKLNVLDVIRKQYGMSFEFYWRLRQSLHYDLAQDMTDKQVFLAQLPNKLKVELSTVMFREELADIKFFSDKSPHFIATIAPLLRPMNFAKGEYVYMNGDPIDAIYFIKRGETAYVDPKPSGDLMFAVNKQGSFFGDVDFTLTTEDGEANRYFSVKAKTDVELLVLQKQDLYQIDLQFKREMTNLFVRSTSQFERLRGYFDKAKEWYEVTNDIGEKSQIQEESEKAEQSSDDEDVDTPKINAESSSISTQLVNRKEAPYIKQLTIKSCKMKLKKKRRSVTLNKSQLDTRSQRQNHMKEMMKSGSFTSLNESGTFGDYVKSFGNKEKNKSKSPAPAIKRPSRFGKEFIPQTYIDARGISDTKVNGEERIASSLSPHSPKLHMKTMRDIGLFESSSPSLPNSLKDKISQMESHYKMMADEFNEMKRSMKAFFRRLEKKIEDQGNETNNNRERSKSSSLQRSKTNVGKDKDSRSQSRNTRRLSHRGEIQIKEEERKEEDYGQSIFLKYGEDIVSERRNNEEEDYEKQREYLFKILKQEQRNGSDKSIQK